MILIDTQMWIWFHQDDPRLPQPIGELLDEAGDGIALSSVSLWEVATTVLKGRIRSDLAAEELIRRWLHDRPLRVLPVDGEIALLARTLPFEHRDPMDRFIGATAHRHSLVLATENAHLRALSWLRVLPIRA